MRKGVVAYSCDNFQKDNVDLLKKIRMNNSGKQAKAAKAAAKAAAAAAAASAGSGSRSESPTGAAAAAAQSKKQGTASTSPPLLAAALPTGNLDFNPAGLPGMSGAFNSPYGGGSLLGGADLLTVRNLEQQQRQMQRLREIAMAEERVQFSLLAQAQMQARAADFQRQMADHSAASAVMKLRRTAGLQASMNANSTTQSNSPTGLEEANRN